jgi:hypothetical protein
MPEPARNGSYLKISGFKVAHYRPLNELAEGADRAIIERLK